MKATPIRDEDGRRWCSAISVIEDVTDRMRRRARPTASSQEASKLLAASLDYPTTLRRVARARGPRRSPTGARSTVDRGPGTLRHVALAAADDRELPLARGCARALPGRPGDAGRAPRDPHGRRRLYRRSATSCSPAGASDERHLELMRGLRMSSVMIAPMTRAGANAGRDDVRVQPGRARTSTMEDLGVAEELARRAATAVDNARLYGERGIHRPGVQESLLPPTLPEDRGRRGRRAVPRGGRRQRGGRRLLRPVRHGRRELGGRHGRRVREGRAGPPR